MSIAPAKNDEIDWPRRVPIHQALCLRLRMELEASIPTIQLKPERCKRRLTTMTASPPKPT